MRKQEFSIDALESRAKSGELTASEIEDVARRLQTSPGAMTYRLLYVIARAGWSEHEGLVASFLEYDEDPQVAALALSTLCVQWRLGPKYVEHLRSYLRGVDWDTFDEARIAAISASGEYLRLERDCPLLQDLVAIAREHDSEMLARFAVEALARALGEPHSRAIPPSGSEEQAWIDSILARGEERLLLECGQP